MEPRIARLAIFNFTETHPGVQLEIAELGGGGVLLSTNLPRQDAEHLAEWLRFLPRITLSLSIGMTMEHVPDGARVQVRDEIWFLSHMEYDGIVRTLDYLLKVATFQTTNKWFITD